MGLLSNWKERKKWLGVRTRGRSLWWLGILMLVVLFVIHMLDRAVEALSR